MKKCRNDNNCAGLYLQSGECHHVGIVNQHSPHDTNGTHYFKKINGSDFSKVALLQKPGDINCLKETDNVDKSCSFPYQYKGTELYACTQCGQEGRVSYSYRYIILDIPVTS